MQIEMSKVLDRLKMKLADAMTTIAVLELQIEELTEQATTIKSEDEVNINER